jgi:hypothetical protein
MTFTFTADAKVNYEGMGTTPLAHEAVNGLLDLGSMYGVCATVGMLASSSLKNPQLANGNNAAQREIYATFGKTEGEFLVKCTEVKTTIENIRKTGL